MKKVGFIDYFLDEWHAQNYPAWIKEASDGEYVVCYAYGKVDGTIFGKKSNSDWSNNLGIPLCDSIEEVVEKCDVLVVLSPDNPEFHEELSRIPLMSGKPTFIDKTFANSKAEAMRIFALAKEHNTPLYSTSALRFDSQYKNTKKEGVAGITSIGGGKIANYFIHQIEPICCFMGYDVSRVMYLGSELSPSFVVEFNDKRCAIISFCSDAPFGLCINYNDGSNINVNAGDNFFVEFIKELVDFFKTDVPKVNENDTIALMAIREAANKACKTPYSFVDVEMTSEGI